MPELTFEGREIPPDLREFFEPVKTGHKTTVFSIPTEPVPFAHFACFPMALVRPCILAGTSAYGCCAACGAPFVRQVEREPGYKAREQDIGGGMKRRTGKALDADYRGIGCFRGETTGWSPSCACPAAPVVPCTVLDPFAGSGTVGEVALSLGRSAVLCELSEEYVKLIRKRLSRAQLPLALGL